MSVEMRTTPMPASQCPRCAYQIEAATSFEGHVPQRGDVTVCIACAGVLVFTEAMTLRAVSDEEYQALDPDLRRQLQIIVRGIRVITARDN